MMARYFRVAAAAALFLTLSPPVTSFFYVEPKVYNRLTLVTRAFPMIQTVNISRGCSDVRLTAEIKGPEDERWYCPKVSWEKPDGAVSTEESDCPPFEDRNVCRPLRGAECALDWHIENGHFVVDNNPCDCTVPGYPRVWHLGLCAPSHPTGDTWEVKVMLTKNSKTLVQDFVRFVVK